mgnify:CR=1 FL=1
MKTHRLGRSGLQVSELCLGCMSFGDPLRGGHPWTLPKDESRDLIRQAIEAGINFLDTANVYSDGSSEEILGEVLWHIARRDEVVLATKVQGVMLRLTPGIQAHTHESISTAHEDVKFGFSIASGAAWTAVQAVLAHPELELRGFHSHIGSQIFETEPFAIAAERLIELLAKYSEEFDQQLPELDLGGGYGIAYLDNESEIHAADVLGALANQVKQVCAKYSLDVPKISIEPGRAIVGPSMFTLYSVGTTKVVTLENGASRNYVSVDGGMSDNLRTALYGAEYTAIIANRESTAKKIATRIVGKHCETGDIIIKDIDFPSDVTPGDLLATPATGAYGRSMATNYNHISRPPVVAIKDGKARVILRRESIEDLLRLDI